MNPKFESRSESKSRIPQGRNTFGRNSLQNENPLFKSRRSSSADRPRNSGGIPKPRSLSEERKSLLCNPRRSSIGLNDCKILKDPRPLSDKGYQRKKVHELVEFITDHSKYQTNASKLMPPSKKDFETIFQILTNFFEPDFVVKRIEEDAPRILKTLRYPFIPAKSAFVYVARTNWPTLLGVLLYLMDLIKYVNSIEDEMFFQSVVVERPHEYAILLKYIINTYCQRLDDEEKDIERTDPQNNIEELREKNKELNEALMNIQKEMDEIQELKAASAGHDNIMKQYEEYFTKMREHRKKREARIEKLSQELAEKEAKVQELENILAEKQAAYDAQGFDGKKQLCYFETQKKELMEKLQSKRAAAKKLTNDCHDAEIQYARTLDEGASVCDTFNELYFKVSEKAASTFDTLKNINDSVVKNMCSKFAFEFPDCKMQLTKKSILHHGDARKSALNEIKKKFDSATLILNSVASKENEKLQEILMKKSDLSVKIKVASSQETKKEHDLNAEEKQVLSEVKTFEAQCEDLLKKLEEVRKETNEIEKENIGLKEEYEELVTLRKKKQRMLDEYLEKQKQMVVRHAAHIEALKLKVEDAGNEIYDVISKALEGNEE
ncbi:putative kinetochore protein ndc80 like protein [Argiope bruennichi]|uniref:Kinetochore protein NDC80 n=1 Tax=Argiope bruennichi TaxID=94029 RepID=A0A8T0EIL5_ARGBR|nr:putative kinetochore protein ndc80 like protein [Argiope bruennichi]